jgi:hypothetical protein
VWRRRYGPGFVTRKKQAKNNGHPDGDTYNPKKPFYDLHTRIIIIRQMKVNGKFEILRIRPGETDQKTA